MRKEKADVKRNNSGTSDTKKRKMIEALEKSLGVVTVAAKSAGISRDTHYDWCNTDAKYKEAVDAISDVALDFVENKLFTNINNGDVPSTIFYLKTKGKRRGYIERIEQTGADGKDLNPQIQVEIIDRRDQVRNDTDNSHIQ